MNEKSVPKLMAQITIMFILLILVMVAGMLLFDLGKEFWKTLSDTLIRYAKMAFG